MAIDKVKAFLRERGMEERVLEFETSSATVELAAQAVGCEPARIAKTLSFHVGDRVALVVAAGDARIDNPKYKARFGCKAKMLAADEAEPLIGHGVGGVCPFALNEGVDVFLDESLRRFDTVYPAAGNAASAVRLTPDELERCAAPCTTRKRTWRACRAIPTLETNGDRAVALYFLTLMNCVAKERYGSCRYRVGRRCGHPDEVQTAEGRS